MDYSMMRVAETMGFSIRGMFPGLEHRSAPPRWGGKKDGLEKKDIDLPQVTRPSQSAFLGPQLWDKTLPYDLMDNDFKDFKLEYMDLDEFFSENHDPMSEELDVLEERRNSLSASQNSSDSSPLLSGPVRPAQRLLENLLTTSPTHHTPAQHSVSALSPIPASVVISPSSEEDSQGAAPSRQAGQKRVWSPTTTRLDVADSIDVMPAEVALASIPGEETFDPKRRAFSVDELRPQPVIKKSKKVFVPDTMKDDRYWNRRTKNNVAAKRSRDARRVKENQIALRAAFLEKENEKLSFELAKMRDDNTRLRSRLSKYEPPSP